MPRPRPVPTTALSPFAANMARLRKERHLSLARLAELVGTKAANITRIEMGAYYPNAELIPKFMEVFDVTADELFREENPDETEIQDLFRRMRKLSAAQRKTVNLLLIAFANKQEVRLLTGPIPDTSDSD